MEKTCLDYADPELKGLIQRVISHYENPNEYLEENLGWLSKHYVKFRGYYSKKLNSLLGNMGIEQVVAISNSGLWLGAMAKSLGYDVRILDVHRPAHFLKHKRHGTIHWYFITPKINSLSCKIYDLNDISTIIKSEEEIKDGIKMGVIDFDNIEEKLKTVIVDADLEQGFSMAVAHKRVLDLGGNVTGRVVISNHTKMPRIIALDELG